MKHTAFLINTSRGAIINEEDFIIEYNSLLKDYVGRPTPLYFAEQISKYHLGNRLEGLNGHHFPSVR